MANATSRKRVKAKNGPQDNQQRNMMIGIAAVVVLVAIGLIYWIQSDANETFSIDDARFAAYAGIPLDESIESNREITEDDDVADGVVRGVLDDGTPFIGDPNAPIIIADFSDFSCPHCATFEPEVELIVENLVKSGQVRLEFRPMTFVGGEFSIVAANAALCAADQGAFWEYHAELFRYQNTQGANYFTVDNMESVADDLGLDGGELRSCMNSRRPEQTLQSAQLMASQNQVSGTPTVLYRVQGNETWSRVNASYQDVVNLVSALGQ